MLRKTRVSVTIDQSLLESVDRASKGKSRSEIVELTLKRWLNERRRPALDEQIAVYYSDRQADESNDDGDWSELSAQQTRKTWK